MKTYLFLFSVGPVQSFISQARKAHDLFAGSRMLSELTATAISSLKKLVVSPSTVELVFPGEKNISNPNRFLTKIITENDQLVREIGSLIEEEIRSKFTKWGNKAFLNLGNVKMPNGYEKQLAAMLDINWVVEELVADNYLESYKKIESLMGSIKNYRKFSQLSEQGRKCSLCGERNSLVFRSGEDNESSSERTDFKDRFLQSDSVNIAKIFSVRFALSNGEGLCAPCFTKRMYKKGDEMFPSTAAIATADTLDKLEKDKEGAQILSKYKSLFDKSDFDEQLLYPENLGKVYFEKQGLGKYVTVLKEAQMVLRELNTKAKELNSPFKKYFAVMMFDGDNMGKWLSGEFLPEDKKSSLQLFHNMLTNQLSEFASSTGINENDQDSIVTKEKGRIIYAGGEDFLGFLNLSTLLTVMKNLRLHFDAVLTEKMSDFTQLKKLTFSAGVVIVHYKTPLSEVLRQVRLQEKAAKGNKGGSKNAFSLAVIKHSGEIHQVTIDWGNKSEPVKNVECLDEIFHSLSSDEISNTFIKSLATEFARVASINGVVPSFLLKPELNRLLGRSSKIEKSETESIVEFKLRKEEKLRKILNAIFQIHEAVDDSLQTVNSALQILDFMNRKIKGEE